TVGRPQLREDRFKHPLMPRTAMRQTEQKIVCPAVSRTQRFIQEDQARALLCALVGRDPVHSKLHHGVLSVAGVQRHRTGMLPPNRAHDDRLYFGECSVVAMRVSDGISRIPLGLYGPERRLLCWARYSESHVDGPIGMVGDGAAVEKRLAEQYPRSRTA